MNPANVAASFPPARRGTALRLLLYTLMTLFGLSITLTGPSLPYLSQQVGAPLDAVGLAFTAGGVGFVSAVLLGGWLVDRVGRRRMLAISLVLMALGSLLVPFAPSLPVLLAVCLILGAGQGNLEVTLNVVAGDLDATQRAAALNQLHLFFGVGSFFGPTVVGMALKLGSGALAWWGMAAISGLMLLTLRRPVPEAPAAATAAEGGAARAAGGPSPYRSLTAYLLAAIFTCYVGIEAGMGGWLPVALQRLTGLSPADAAVWTSPFWLAVAGGRLLGIWALRRISETRFLAGMMLGTGAGLVLFILGGRWAPLAIGAAVLTGLCLGPVFPTALGYATTRFSHAVGPVSAMMIASGSIGGTLVPPLQGRVLVQWGVVPAMALLAGLAALKLLLLGLAACRSRPSPLPGHR